jgi:hypothetical protein
MQSTAINKDGGIDNYLLMRDPSLTLFLNLFLLLEQTGELEIVLVGPEYLRLFPRATT